MNILMFYPMIRVPRGPTIMDVGLWLAISAFKNLSNWRRTGCYREADARSCPLRPPEIPEHSIAHATDT